MAPGQIGLQGIHEPRVLRRGLTPRPSTRLLPRLLVVLRDFTPAQFSPLLSSALMTRIEGETSGFPTGRKERIESSLPFPTGRKAWRKIADFRASRPWHKRRSTPLHRGGPYLGGCRAEQRSAKGVPRASCPCPSMARMAMAPRRLRLRPHAEGRILRPFAGRN